jgi:type IV pilus assembly protein PilN
VISVNLLPKEERTEERQLVAAPRKTFLLPLGVIVATTVPILLLYFLQTTKIQGLRSDILVAEQESQRLKPQIEKINQLMQAREDLNLRLNLVGELNRARTLPVQVLDELALQMPDHLWLTKLTQSGPTGVALEGMTFSNLVIADLMARLEATDLYADIGLTKAERKTIGADKVLAFTLTGRIEP